MEAASELRKLTRSLSKSERLSSSQYSAGRRNAKELRQSLNKKLATQSELKEKQEKLDSEIRALNRTLDSFNRLTDSHVSAQHSELRKARRARSSRKMSSSQFQKVVDRSERLQKLTQSSRLRSELKKI